MMTTVRDAAVESGFELVIPQGVWAELVEGRRPFPEEFLRRWARVVRMDPAEAQALTSRFRFLSEADRQVVALTVRYVGEGVRAVAVSNDRFVVDAVRNIVGEEYVLQPQEFILRLAAGSGKCKRELERLAAELLLYFLRYKSGREEEQLMMLQSYTETILKVGPSIYHYEQPAVVKQLLDRYTATVRAAERLEDVEAASIEFLRQAAGMKGSVLRAAVESSTVLTAEAYFKIFGEAYGKGDIKTALRCLDRIVSMASLLSSEYGRVILSTCLAYKSLIYHAYGMVELAGDLLRTAREVSPDPDSAIFMFAAVPQAEEPARLEQDLAREGYDMVEIYKSLAGEYWFLGNSHVARKLLLRALSLEEDREEAGKTAMRILLTYRVAEENPPANILEVLGRYLSRELLEDRTGQPFDRELLREGRDGLPRVLESELYIVSVSVVRDGMFLRAWNPMISSMIGVILPYDSRLRNALIVKFDEAKVVRSVTSQRWLKGQGVRAKLHLAGDLKIKIVEKRCFQA